MCQLHYLFIYIHTVWQSIYLITFWFLSLFTTMSHGKCMILLYVCFIIYSSAVWQSLCLNNVCFLSLTSLQGVIVKNWYSYMSPLLLSTHLQYDNLFTRSVSAYAISVKYGKGMTLLVFCLTIYSYAVC